MITSKNKHLKRYLIIATCLLLGVPIYVIGSFLISEWHREILLKQYTPSEEVLMILRSTGTKSASTLLRDNEIMVCALGSYGRTDELNDLTETQKVSLQKDSIPSEDGAWYLLYFTESSISRIFLIDSGPSGIEIEGGHCVRRAEFFTVSDRAAAQDGSRIHLSFQQTTRK
jgi:hypothetical protein